WPSRGKMGDPTARDEHGNEDHRICISHERMQASTSGDQSCRWPRRQLVSSSFARAKKLARAAECLVHSLTPSGFWAENHLKNRGFVGILRGQKCLKRRFSRRSQLESGLAARARCLGFLAGVAAVSRPRSSAGGVSS